MPTHAPHPKPSENGLHRRGTKPIVVKNWDDMAAYLAKKLKPVAKGPKGQPIYDDREVRALNIRLVEPS